MLLVGATFDRIRLYIFAFGENNEQAYSGVCFDYEVIPQWQMDKLTCLEVV